MARILVTTHPGLGHLNPLVPLARALQRAGHELRVATAPSFAPMVERRGLSAAPAGLDWQERAVEETFPGFLRLTGDEQLRILAGQASRAMAGDLARLAREWRPDLIIRDNSEYGGWAVAEEVRIPSVAYGVISRLPAGPLHATIGTQLDALRAARGLRPDPDLRTLDEERCLDPTPGSLKAFPSSPATARVVSVRPVFDDSGPDDALPAWATEATGRPLIFATLGTVFHRNDVLYDRLLSAVASQPYRVILAGAELPPGSSVPANVQVERYVPLSRVLPYCAAVISHAGRGTTLTALSYGVPVCLFPLSAEQPMTAGPVQRAGAGVVCATDEIQVGPFTFPITDPRRLDARRIRAQIEQLLGAPEFRAAARLIQQEIASLPAPSEVAAMVATLIASG